ncbi:hypothetical protein [Halobacillus massiliensis]|uniref:hypothetical protein n=1 Tax=Halobacillus massiliensis TaxID=1926286 RepID=UPI0009E4BB7D|nr:hypothetical protein [Halobacillus massiliensis]
MRYFILGILIVLVISGCDSQPEAVRAGDPVIEETEENGEYTIEGHEIYKEIVTQEEIKQVKILIDQFESMNKSPEKVSAPPDLFFELYEPENSVSIHQFYVWTNTKGRATVRNSDGDYYRVNEEDTETLLELLRK